MEMQWNELAVGKIRNQNWRTHPLTSQYTGCLEYKTHPRWTNKVCLVSKPASYVYPRLKSRHFLICTIHLAKSGSDGKGGEEAWEASLCSSNSELCIKIRLTAVTRKLLLCIAHYVSLALHAHNMCDLHSCDNQHGGSTVFSFPMQKGFLGRDFPCFHEMTASSSCNVVATGVAGVNKNMPKMQRMERSISVCWDKATMATSHGSWLMRTNEVLPNQLQPALPAISLTSSHGDASACHWL